MNSGFYNSPYIYPETRPLNPSAYDDEFDGVSLSSKWNVTTGESVGAIGSNLFFDRSSLILKTAPPAVVGDVQSLSLMQSIPSQQFAWKGKFELWNLIGGLASVGLSILDASNKRYDMLIQNNLNTLRYVVQKVNADGTFNSFLFESVNFGTINTTISSNQFFGSNYLGAVFQIRYSGTTLFFDYSLSYAGDIPTNMCVNLTSDLITSFFTSPPRMVGIYLCNGASASWVRYRPSAQLNEI